MIFTTTSILAATALTFNGFIAEQWALQTNYLDRVPIWECGATPRNDNYNSMRVEMKITRTGTETAQIVETSELVMLNGRTYDAVVKYSTAVKIDAQGEVFLETSSAQVVSLDQLPSGYNWGDVTSTRMMLAMKKSRFGQGNYLLKGWSHSPGVIMDVTCAAAGM